MNLSIRQIIVMLTMIIAILSLVLQKWYQALLLIMLLVLEVRIIWYLNYVRVTSILAPIMKNGIATKSVKYILKSNGLNQNSFMQRDRMFVDLLLNQKPYCVYDQEHKKSDYYLYVIDYETKRIEQAPLDKCDITGFHLLEYSDGKQLSFVGLDCDALNMLLHKNNGKKYVYVPITCSSHIKTQAHRNGLIFNLQAHEIYFVDPNGKPTYYDKILDEQIIDTEICIDALIKTYINDLNELCNQNYKFIPRIEWNECGEFNLNPETNTNENDNFISGNCVVALFIIFYMVERTGQKPSEVLKMLDKLELVDLKKIIDACNIGVVEIMSNLHKLDD